MYKASVVGIDNAGKTSVVKALGGLDGIKSIHLTSYENSGSITAKMFGKMANRMAQFSEYHNQRRLTGFAYLIHLAPYYFAEMRAKHYDTLVSDRDPIVDTLCYLAFYHPISSTAIRPPLKFLLEHVFNYPELFIYLKASPEVSLRRNAARNNKQKQLHENIEALIMLRELFDREVFRLEKDGVKVLRIDTDIKSLEDVIEEAKHSLGIRARITIPSLV